MAEVLIDVALAAVLLRCYVKWLNELVDARR